MEKKMIYTLDAKPLYSGTISFEGVPEYIFEAMTKLLEGYGLLKGKQEPAKEPERPAPDERLTMAEKLRKLRMRSGLSVRQVANWCSVTPTTVHRWEKGDREPRSTCKERLRSLYGVQSLHILADDEKERAK